MSKDKLSKSCALVTSLVDKDNLCKAGLNFSSATPVAKDVAKICFSTDAIMASVAPVAFFRAVARRVCAASSSIAALTPSTPILTAYAAAAIPAAANANPAFLPKSPIFDDEFSTSLLAALSDLLS